MKSLIKQNPVWMHECMDVWQGIIRLFNHSIIQSFNHTIISTYTHAIILLVIFVSFSGFISAQDCNSRLDINTNIPASVIFVNGKLAGNGSVSLDLEKGKYFITAKNNKLTWDAQVFSDSVEIDNCNQKKVIFYNFRDEIYINSQPGNAQVIYQDSLLGYTPFFLRSKLDQVEVKKGGYESKLIQLNNKQYSYSIDLDFNGNKNDKSFFKTNLFKILVGTAVALGGTAAYYKLKADDSFEQYNRTQDPSHLNSTNNYDLISGIAFGALQVNFGVLIYYFLTD